MLSKSQVDRCGELLRQGDVDQGVIEKLEAYRSEFEPPYRFVTSTLRDKLGFDVTGRPAKSTIAIIEKLRRQKSRLSQIQDIAGCRIVLPSIVSQNEAVAASEVMLENVRIDDKRQAPTHAYRAVHLIVSRGGKLIEVQIRSRLQHFWAEFSEKMADEYGQGVKYGEGSAAVIAFLARLSDQIAKIEQRQSSHAMLVKDPTLASRPLGQIKKRIVESEKQIRLEAYRLREVFQEGARSL